jgi:Cu(I)/Ag(I) efflux system periplasmic protein CusF
MKLSYLLLLLALAVPTVQAQTSPAPAKPATPAPTRPLPLARGEVLEVDRQAASVMVKHGPIPSLGMDPMTMEFLVPNPKLLASLKPGDKIRFAAAFKDGDYVMTRAEVVKPRASQRSKSAPPGQ